MMDKTILFLIVFGIALAVVCEPNMMFTLGIIGCLVIAFVKLSWQVLEVFSTSTSASIDPNRRPTRRTSFT